MRLHRRVPRYEGESGRERERERRGEREREEERERERERERETIVGAGAGASAPAGTPIRALAHVGWGCGGVRASAAAAHGAHTGPAQ